MKYRTNQEQSVLNLPWHFLDPLVSYLGQVGVGYAFQLKKKNLVSLK